MDTSTVHIESVFPTDWAAVQVDGGPFQFDPMHFPFPVSPLTASTAFAFETGYATALRECNVPVQEMQVRHVNHYRYERMIPLLPANEEEAAAQDARVEETLKREMERMLDRWFGEHRPRIVAHQERLRSLQPHGASSNELLAMLDEVDDIHRDLWTIHFRIAVPMLLSMQLFTEFHGDVFGQSPGEAQGLMKGSVSESLKAGFELAEVAELARTLELEETILTIPAGDLLQALEATENGREFQKRLHSYLEAYGLRQDLFDFTTPTWQEDPTFALSSIRSYLQTGHDPRAEHEEMVRSVGEAFDLARATLAAYPEPVREQFETLVQHARQGAFLQEEHNFYIDQQCLALLRLFYLGIGEQMRDLGVLAEPEDIFMLRLEEVRDALGLPDARTHAEHVRTLVSDRRAELAEAAVMAPPPFLGDRSTSPPPPDTPLRRGMMAFFGGPPQEAEAPGQLKGNPGSRGVVSGPARIAHTLEEAKEVRPGEILVAVTTMPPWTPLFGIAVAVVTETGGALSHCAIVAREYGIPAVVGVFGATRSIANGQRVTVDGDKGIVLLET